MFVIAHASCIVTLESPKSNSFDLCVRKHMWEAKSKLKTISKEVKRKGKSKLKASYKQAKSKLEASSKQAKSKITARWKQAKSKPKTCEKQAKSKLKASCQRKVVTLAFAQDDSSVATHIRPYVRIRKTL